MYEQEFINAIKRTHQFGLPIPKELKQTTKRFLTEKVQLGISDVIHKNLGELSEDDIMLQCLQLNMRLKPVFFEYFQSPVYYTIGHISLDEDSFYKQTEESLQAMLLNGVEGPSVSLHAWITLPSMEILDFSFPTTYGKLNEQKGTTGAVLALHPSNLSGGMSYHPMIIGEEFLHKIGAMKLHVAI